METSTTPPRPVSFADLLGDTNYRRLWLTSNSANLGSEISRVALPLLVFAITGSAGLLGLVYVITMVPRIVLSPFAGIIADRFDRRRIMLAADTARMVLVCLLPFTDQVWQITTIATLTAVFGTLAVPAQMAAVPMVAGKDRLLQAISLAQISRATIGIVGPAIGAALVGLLGAGPSFFIQGVCFAVSIIFVIGLYLPPSDEPPAEGLASLAAWWHELTLGFRVTWRLPVIRGLVGAEMVWGAAEVILVVGLVAYTERTLELGSRAGITFALFTAAFSVGTVIGGLLASRVQQRLGRPFMVLFGYTAPALLMVIWFTPPLPVVFTVLILFGLSDSWLVAASQQIIVEQVPDPQRGRLFAAFVALVSLTYAFWNGGLGAFIDQAGSPAAFLLVGLFCGIGCPLILLATGAIRGLRMTDAQTAPPPAAQD